MAAEVNKLHRPERARDALATQSSVTSSPTTASDDDTISNNSFESGSDHFAFTPKRPATTPRAWERKASTPFAPRTETQKIWKRVPLQDKSSNGFTEIRESEKEEVDSRGVKRVRLAVADSGDGKENYANTQWDKQSDDAKRKLPELQKNALQSTRNSLSPLRRDSTYEILNEPPRPTALEVETDRVIWRLSQMQEEESKELEANTGADELPITAELKEEATRSEMQPHQLQEDSLEDHTPQTQSSVRKEPQSLGEEANISSEDAVTTTPSTSAFFTDSIIFDDQESESEIDEPPIAQEAIFDTDTSDSGSDYVSHEDNPDTETIPQYSTLPQAAQIEPLETCQMQPDSSSRAVMQEVSQAQIDGMEVGKVATSETETVVEDKKDVVDEDATPVLNGSESIPDLTDTADDISEQYTSVVEPGTPSSNAAVSKSESVDAQPNNEPSKTCLVPGTSPEDNKVSLETVTKLQIPTESTSQEAGVTKTTAIDPFDFEASTNILGTQLFTPQVPPISAPDAPPSDDTAYLHDFLTRARAQKAARAATSPQKMGIMASSPAKNTRQALANLSNNPLSPVKSSQTELKPEEPMEDELSDEEATSPCRRSSRPRLPKLQKSVVPTIPSTIPVRRSNGTEFVFLHRTEAMQVALATRTNTKRNKGEALAPSARLETIASVEPSPIKEKKKRGAKTAKKVQWDENLTQEQVDTVPEEQILIVEHEPETKPELLKAEEKPASEAEKSAKKERRKVKRLGTVNGTPAPKKVMATTALPVPTRTLRARTKG